MDNKRLIITVAVLMLLVLSWERMFTFIGEKMGWNMAPKPVAQSTESTASSAAPTTSPVGSTQPSQISAATVPSGFTTAAVNSEGTLSLGATGDQTTTFPIGLYLTTRGAGIGSVTLIDYKAMIGNPEPFTYQTGYTGLNDLSRPLATQNLTVNGVTRDLSNANWKLENANDRSATYSLDLVDDAKPLVKLTKTYQMFDRNDVGNGSGYEVAVTQTIQNLTDHPLATSAQFIGTTPPPREAERGGDRQILTGYLSNDSIDMLHHTVEEFTKDKATKDLAYGGENKAPLAWAGTCSGYFDAIIRPLTVGSMLRVTATGLDPNPDALEHNVVITYGSDATIAPGASASFPVRAFFGPKSRKILKSDYYSKIPLHYDSSLVISSGPCSYCAFDPLISLLVNALGVFHFIFRDWGIAIIVLVICVRAMLHPIMKRSQANMMKMGRMGPEIEKLKKKYPDDKDAVAKAQMQLMKEQGFTPILGCLPMFLQMPIFIALWSCLQSTFELRQAPFLAPWGHHLTWIKDLSQPDHLFFFPNYPISFLFIHLNAINLLPILVAIVSFINQKVMPKPPAATPEAAQQQKMMQWMTLVFPLMFYNLPSGLNLYYVTSTSLGIVEGKIIRRHIKEREEAEKGDRIIVDAKPTRGSKQSKKDETPTEQKRTGVMGAIAGLVAQAQEKVEQIQRDAERRSKDNKA